MAHEKLNINITREWANEQAKAEPDNGVTSVGGLAHRLGGLEKISGAGRKDEAEPRRQSLGKFIELSRRRMRLSVEQLATKANIDLAELYAIEKAEDVVPDLRTIHQLAQVFHMRAEPLLELAGLAVIKSVGLTESAVRFAARSEPVNALTKEEEEALNWFVKELSKA